MSSQVLPISAKYANGCLAGFRNRNVQSYPREDAFPTSNRSGHWANYWMTYNSDRISLMVEHGDFYTNPPYLPPTVYDLKIQEWREIETKRRREREREEKRDLINFERSRALILLIVDTVPYIAKDTCVQYLRRHGQVLYTPVQHRATDLRV